MASLLLATLLFWLIALGLAWPLTARWALEPAEKLLATIACSLIATYLAAFGLYAAGLPVETLRLLPALAGLNLFVFRRPLLALLTERAPREALAWLIIVTAGGLACLALVPSYSGGGWIGDWFGHWQRTLFFLERWPRETLFNGFDPLASRPPLVNLLTGALLACTQADFAHYQVVTTVASAAVFLPAALLARRFGSEAGGTRLLAVLFLANPLFLQNATFAWTKLPAAFFTLTALYFFLRSHDAAPPRAAPILFSMSLAAALLAHYSAGPFAVLFAIGWFWLGWPRRREAAWWRGTALAALAGAALLATWFGWAFAVYGIKGTLLANTTATDYAGTFAGQAHAFALNFRDTLVPHFLRTVDFTPFTQLSASGGWRDWFFFLYQTNLLFAFGSVTWLALLCALPATWKTTPARRRIFWVGFIVGAILLGVGAHSGRDPWGLAHICLQPLVLLGLAWIAARWSSLSRGWRMALLAGLTLDVLLGIVLHFGVQNTVIDRWLAPRGGTLETIFRYSEFARMNLRAKLQNHWVFVHDIVPLGAVLLGLGLAALAATLLLRTPPARQVAAAVAIAAAGLCAWTAWCEFPAFSWNDLRLGPAFALRHGLEVYPVLGDGPLSTWIYGPVGLLLNLPATWAGSALAAVQTAGAINLIVVIVPLALVLFGAAGLRGRGLLSSALALALAVLLLPRSTLMLQLSDHAAVAFGLLSSWHLARAAAPTTARLIGTAALATLAIWSKQLAVFVVVGQLVYLWLARERATALRYAAIVALANLLTLGVATLAFGWGNLWLNLVSIPGRLPWAADPLHRLRLHAALLLGQCALPWLALALLRRTRFWPARDTEIGRYLRCSLCVSLALLTIGLASLLKYGGNTNVLHSWGHLLPALLVLGLSLELPRPFLPALAALALALQLPRTAEWRFLPARESYDRAAEIVAARPGKTWFPTHPVISFYADGRLWHTHDGIVTRDLAGYGLREADFRRHLPADLRVIVHPRGMVAPVALQLLPEFNQAFTDGVWLLHTRPGEMTLDR